MVPVAVAASSELVSVELVPTALAVVAVALFAVGLGAMTAGSYAVAGTSFMSASIVIYLRETRTGNDPTT